MRKKFGLLLLGAALSMSAAPMSFWNTLSGAAEDPSVVTPGNGLTVVTIDPVAHTLSVFVDFQDLIGATTASHIHVINGPGDLNPADTNGPVATQVPTFPGFPLGVMAGTYSQSFDTLSTSTYRPGFLTDAGGTAAAAEAALFAGIMEGRAYLNVHSTFSPSGEVRGFLQPVPEPATAAVAGCALGALFLLRRRQRSAGSRV